MPAKKKSKRARAAHPSPAMINDLVKVMKKHKFVGRTLMWKPMATAALAGTAGNGPCPPGTSPHQITVQLPDGTWVAKTVCS